MKNWLKIKLNSKFSAPSARVYQILFLSSFIALGISFKDLRLSLVGFLTCVLSAFLCQIGLEKLFNIDRPNSILSASITSLSICLLIRSNQIWIYPLMAAMAIASKFFLKSHGQHIFNPANFAIIIALLFLEPVWISSSLWGQSSSFFLWFMFLGLLVTQKTSVSLPSFAFLLFYFSLTAMRTLYLGFEFLVWAHEFQSGALMIFTFFMLSDPKTSPDTYKGQLIYAAIIACVSFVMKHLLFIDHAIFYSLIVACFISNYCLKQRSYQFKW